MLALTRPRCGWTGPRIANEMVIEVCAFYTVNIRSPRIKRARETGSELGLTTKAGGAPSSTASSYVCLTSATASSYVCYWYSLKKGERWFAPKKGGARLAFFEAIGNSIASPASWMLRRY
jgi:hypothetical protein